MCVYTSGFRELHRALMRYMPRYAPRVFDTSGVSVRRRAARISAGKFRIVGLPTDAGPTSRVIRRAIYFTGGGSALTWSAARHLDPRRFQ